MAKVKCDCENCGYSIGTDRRNIGRRARCPKCNEKTRLFESVGIDEVTQPPAPAAPQSPAPNTRDRRSDVIRQGTDVPALHAIDKKLGRISQQLQGIGCMLLVLVVAIVVIPVVAWFLLVVIAAS